MSSSAFPVTRFRRRVLVSRRWCDEGTPDDCVEARARVARRGRTRAGSWPGRRAHRRRRCVPLRPPSAARLRGRPPPMGTAVHLGARERGLGGGGGRRRQWPGGGAAGGGVRTVGLRAMPPLPDGDGEL